MKKVVILGTSGHARVITDIFRSSGEYQVVGYLTSDTSLTEFESMPVLGNENDYFQKKENLEGQYFFIAVGDNYLRSVISEKLKQLYSEVKFATAIHATAVLSPSAIIEVGSCVMANTVINAHSRIGKHCILNTASTIDHDGIMHDFSSLAPGVSLGGNVEIGQYSAVSIGAVVVHKIMIGENSVIGAGAVVTKSIPANVVAYGTPCKVIRSREKGEKYL